MKKKHIIKISYFILYLLSVISCRKDEYIYVRDYISDNGVSVNVFGTAGENELNESHTMKLYENYYDSEIDLNSSGISNIRIVRYTNDFQSNIVFIISLDKNNVLLNAQCFFDFNFIISNKIVRLSNFFYLNNNLTINNFLIDINKGNLQFDYSIDYRNNKDVNLIVNGTADTKIYKY